MTSHADNHDRDKLSRWRGDLTSGDASTFPVYAVFLVTPEDRAAHDIFRAYRGSFEQRGAGFQHLMIFGQHGVSTTVKGLLAELGLGLDSLPLLGLFPGPPSDAIHTIGLRQGDYGSGESGDAKALNGPWMDVLGFLEQAADGGGEALNLNLEGNLKPLSLGAGAMGQIVERVLGSVS
jgi:hypothetical protein